MQNCAISSRSIDLLITNSINFTFYILNFIFFTGRKYTLFSRKTKTFAYFLRLNLSY